MFMRSQISEYRRIHANRFVRTKQFPIRVIKEIAQMLYGGNQVLLMALLRQVKVK